MCRDRVLALAMATHLGRSTILTTSLEVVHCKDGRSPISQPLYGLRHGRCVSALVQ